MISVTLSDLSTVTKQFEIGSLSEQLLLKYYTNNMHDLIFNLFTCIR